MNMICIVTFSTLSKKQRNFTGIYNSKIDAIERKSQIMENHPAFFASSAEVYPVIKCHCGRKVDCYQFTNVCECGADYNFNGDLLAGREQWGVETGEHWSECY